ncbi:MAG: T9SS type A sorting domain-containing protein, partial [Bacteroidales bacterium]|nr:T9SS type A sorting domain-containing protein [Bacteroidales bacterium]
YLIIKNSYLANVLNNAGDDIDVEVIFNLDFDNSDSFTITAIENGLTKPSFNPNSFTINGNDMPEYIETTITWNDANSIENINLYRIEKTYVYEDEWLDYEIIPIDANTATLKLNIPTEDDKAKNSSKDITTFNVFMKVNFDLGEPNYLFINILEEFFYVNIAVNNSEAGWYNGADEYFVGEQVNIEAISNSNYFFEKWVFEGGNIVSDNPFTFTMPANDVNIYAVFNSDYPFVINSTPVSWNYNEDPNTNFYIKFNQNIAEGNLNNGFGDINLINDYDEEHLINNIYILNEDMLVIEPDLPLEFDAYYTLNIPKESIVSADNTDLTMLSDYYLPFATGYGNFQTGEISPYQKYYGISTVNDVDFNIIWGDETEITKVLYYYWDYVNNAWVDIILSEGTDYVINENILTIKSSFISSFNLEDGDHLNMECHFGSGYYDYFIIEIIDSYDNLISPENVNYDLSNPNDIYTLIMFANAEAISSISYNSTNLIENTDFSLIQNILNIKNSFLSQHLINLGDEIELIITLNNNSSLTLTITAIESGIISATINPQFIELINEMPDYFDIVITWNDANNVTAILLHGLSDIEIVSIPFSYYEITNIDSETSMLRIFLDAKKSTSSKYIEEASVLFEIIFDIGSPAILPVHIMLEAYNIEVSTYPNSAGWAWYEGYAAEGETISIIAEANAPYQFAYWTFDNIMVSTENPYEFIMPDHDLNITAHFIHYEDEIFTVSLNSNPANAGVLQGIGEYPLATNVSIKATANSGYEFINWTNEEDEIVSTNTIYNFSIFEDKSFTANFDIVENIKSNIVNEINIYPNPFNEVLYISNIENINKITITSITGQIISEFVNLENNEINTSMLPRGFYLVIFDKTDGSRQVNKVTKQ